MRTLIVTRSIPAHPGAGGMERVAWDLARSIPGAMVLTTPVPGRGSAWAEDGVQVVTVEDVKPGRYSMGWWLKTARAREVRDYDVVMSVSAAGTSMIHFQRGPEYVFQAHGTARKELRNAVRVRPRLWPLKAARFAYWTALDALTYRRASAVVAVSETVAESLREWPYRGAWKRTRLGVIPNAVDTEHFAPDAANRVRVRERLGINLALPVIACVSRLDRQKGVDRAIEAVATLEPHFHLIVAGTGPEERSLRDLARLSGAADRIHFVGRVDYDGVRDVLHAADAFVFPVRNAEREGMPMAVLEALAADLTVVVPEGSRWPDDVAERVTFADVGDPAALGESIHAALLYR